MADKDIDEISGVETMGHEWDGIKELNNPLPRWWLYSFYACIAFAIGYIIWYPAIPLLDASTPGLSGQTNRKALKQEMAAAQASKQHFIEKINNASLEEIRGDEELSRFSVAGGKSAFKVYCSQCHGSGAQGGPGYPNLNDDDWLWGGDLEAIYTTIKHGIRFEHDDDTRISDMPAFGKDELLEREQISQVANYVLKLSGANHDEALAKEGATVFEDNCAACHGERGNGSRDVGAPDLADAISLYGNNATRIAAQINNPKHGVMPAWDGRLSEATIKELTIYVHNLGGGE